jgi:hypothetical protein
MSDAEQFQVTSTEPIELNRPFRTLRRIRLLVLLIGLAIVVFSAASSYAGYEFGAQRTNAQIAELNRERATNRATLMNAQATIAKTVETYREALCALIQRTQPDPEINRQRTTFHCGPYLAPSSPGRQATQAPTPVPSVPVARPTLTPRPRPTPTPTRPPPTVAPTPPPPSPSPPPLVCILFLCL